MNRQYAMIIALLLTTGAYASDITYASLSMQYQMGVAKNIVIANATQYLQTHPHDGDVRVLLAKCFIDNHDDLSAKQELLQVLTEFPNDSDASLMLINLDIAHNNVDEAQHVVDMALVYNPSNPDLRLKEEQLTTLIHAQKTPLGLAYQPSETTTVRVDEYEYIKALFKSGKRTAAMTKIKTYLEVYPQDQEAHFILGTFYFNMKYYESARRELSLVLKNNPQNLDARLVLINADMSTHRYHEAEQLVHSGLKLAPHNADLRRKQKQIMSEQRAFEQPAVAEKIAPPAYRNEIGIYQQQYYISNNHQVWDYSTVYYGRQLNWGKAYVKATYDNRFYQQAVQGEIEAFPKINDQVYLDLDLAFANKPELFPSQSYAGEVFFSNPKAYSFSGGTRYNYVDQRHYFMMYTASLTKDLNQNRITLRPYFFQPGHGGESLLYLLDLHHTVNDPFFFFGCILGTGTSPDLANLTTINFIVLKNKLISPYINFPLFHDRLIVNLSALLQNQKFITGVIRNWYGGTIGLNWKY